MHHTLTLHLLPSGVIRQITLTLNYGSTRLYTSSAQDPLGSMLARVEELAAGGIQHALKYVIINTDGIKASACQKFARIATAQMPRLHARNELVIQYRETDTADICYDKWLEGPEIEHDKDNWMVFDVKCALEDVEDSAESVSDAENALDPGNSPEDTL